MNEVTRGLPGLLGFITGSICEFLVRNSTTVQCCQDGLVITRITTYAMLILGIDIATTDTRLHVNQVEFHDTGDVTPVFLIKPLTGTLF